MPTWVQCPKTGKFIPKEQYQRYGSDAPAIHGDIESFKSPIDGSIISDRAQLRRHNAQHGVTDMRDYSEDFFKSKALKRQEEHSGTSKKAKQERIDLINRVLDHYERN